MKASTAFLIITLDLLFICALLFVFVFMPAVDLYKAEKIEQNLGTGWCQAHPDLRRYQSPDVYAYISNMIDGWAFSWVYRDWTRYTPEEILNPNQDDIGKYDYVLCNRN